MILLVTRSERAPACVEALRAALGEEVVVASSLARATSSLREQIWLAVIFDQHVLETEAHEAHSVYEHLDTAIAIHVNLGVSGLDRLVQDVRLTFARARKQEARTRTAAVLRLQAELNSIVTVLLLASELALRTPGLSSPATERIEAVYELVKRLREQIKITETPPPDLELQTVAVLPSGLEH